jgi:hypothetical protein
MPLPPTPSEGQPELPPSPPGEPLTGDNGPAGPSADEGGAIIRPIPTDEYDPLPASVQTGGAPADVQGAEFLAPYEVHSPDASPIAP